MAPPPLDAGLTGPRRRLAVNPFYVLGLRPDCSRAEIEREGQKLLSMLELGLAAASHYASPVGRHPRSAEAVREAMSELRDPQRRLVHELWAALDTSPPEGGAPPSAEQAYADCEADQEPGAAFPALAILGFGDSSRWRRR